MKIIKKSNLIHNISIKYKDIGFVPQDPFLFSDTISNNIKFGKEKATKQEIIDAAKKQ